MWRRTLGLLDAFRDMMGAPAQEGLRFFPLFPEKLLLLPPEHADLSAVGSFQSLVLLKLVDAETKTVGMTQIP